MSCLQCHRVMSHDDTLGRWLSSWLGFYLCSLDIWNGSSPVPVRMLIRVSEVMNKASSITRPAQHLRTSVWFITNWTFRGYSGAQELPICAVWRCAVEVRVICMYMRGLTAVMGFGSTDGTGITGWCCIRACIIRRCTASGESDRVVHPLYFNAL